MGAVLRAAAGRRTRKVARCLLDDVHADRLIPQIPAPLGFLTLALLLEVNEEKTTPVPMAPQPGARLPVRLSWPRCPPGRGAVRTALPPPATLPPDPAGWQCHLQASGTAQHTPQGSSPTAQLLAKGPRAVPRQMTLPSSDETGPKCAPGTGRHSSDTAQGRKACPRMSLNAALGRGAAQGHPRCWCPGVHSSGWAARAAQGTQQSTRMPAPTATHEHRAGGRSASWEGNVWSSQRSPSPLQKLLKHELLPRFVWGL